MISNTLGTATTLYNYNGDGARLRQVAAGTPTTYTQDLAAPLPVVLQSKTGATVTSYEFSNGTRPVGQFNANGSGTWGYLLPDALGSVRQIAALNGSLTLAKTYDPYGSVVKTNGSGTSIFGFSGEQTDASGLTYLRARYMQPKLGVFLSRDPVSGNTMQPESMNGFNYANDNPARYIDPSGHQAQCPINGWDCEAVNNVVTLKDAFLDSAARHNRIPDMDTNGFAALIASVIVSEGRIGNVRSFGDRILNGIEDFVANGGCIVSGHSIFQALGSLRVGDAISYWFNQKVPEAATVGIGNVSLDTAANLWKGPFQVSKLQVSSDVDNLCWDQTICGIDNINRGRVDTVDIPNPFGYQVWCFDTPDSKCRVSIPSDKEAYQLLEHQLLDNKINIEYVAANLEAGALRALSLDPPLQPSAFNSAAWHLRGIESDREIETSKWQPCPGGACLIVDYIPTALTVMGLNSTWNKNMEPQYAHWKVLYP